MLDAHFRAIADEGGLPIVVYNVPSRTGANVEADTFLRLAEHPRVVAVKEASGNIEQIAVICRDRPRDVAVLSGDDAATLAVLAMGGDGVISVASNEIPGEMPALCAAARRATGTEARRIHDRLLPLFRANFQGAPNPVPAKAAMVAMGLLERDDLRAPLLPLAEAPRERLVELLRALGLVDGGGRRPLPAAGPDGALTGGDAGGGRMSALETLPGAPDPATGRVVASILDDLDAGRRRAAVRDPGAPAAGGPTPRSRPRSSPASATARRPPGTSTARSGSATGSGCRPSRCSMGPRPTRRWRPAVRGGSCRAGPASGPASTSVPVSS